VKVQELIRQEKPKCSFVETNAVKLAELWEC